MHALAYRHAHMHKLTHALECTTQAHIHTYSHTHTHTHVNKHMYMRTHAHTNTHTYTYVQRWATLPTGVGAGMARLFRKRVRGCLGLL